MVTGIVGQPLSVACVAPSGAISLHSVTYSASALHALVGGWFDHVRFTDGPEPQLVMAWCEAPADVAADLGLDVVPASYRIPRSKPVVFMRSGDDGGFASIRTDDLPTIAAITGGHLA